jgi:hypothetical protein
MALYVIKFFADPTSPESSKISYFFADSVFNALKWAQAALPEHRAQHAMACYRIEDASGHTVWAGREKDDGAASISA